MKTRRQQVLDDIEHYVEYADNSLNIKECLSFLALKEDWATENVNAAAKYNEALKIIRELSELLDRAHRIASRMQGEKGRE